MRALLVCCAVLLLAGCPGPEGVKVTAAPNVIRIPVATYVPIDKQYTARCAWVEDGDIIDIFPVARDRKTCLIKYEAQFDAIEKLQGNPVPAPLH